MKFIRLLALLLALFCVVSVVACKKEEEPETPPVEEDTSVLPVKSEAITGTELYWEIYRDGTLHVKGTGDMGEELISSAELGYNEQPWAAYARTSSESSIVIKKVVVGEGVTGLSQNSFQDCLYLELVELPTTLTEIPRDCFRGCTSLKRVFGKNVTVVGDGAFVRCERLQRLTFSTLLESVGQGAFFEAGTKSDRFELRLVGSETEWQEGEGVAIVEPENANKFFADAMQSPVFISR